LFGLIRQKYDLFLFLLSVRWEKFKLFWFFSLAMRVGKNQMCLIVRLAFTLSDNVLGLGEVGDFEAPMFNLLLMFNRSINVQFSTIAPILPNPC
jgi:hypothetical protein